MGAHVNTLNRTLRLSGRVEPPSQEVGREREKVLRRIDTLTAAVKSARACERYWRAIALSCLTSATNDPAAQAGERFHAGLAALLDGLEVENAHVAPQLSAEAADFVLRAVHGPHIALYLVNDPALAERLAGLAPADQLVELGRVSVAVEAALRPAAEVPRSVEEIFGLATRSRP
jgi:hypothetical protein